MAESSPDEPRAAFDNGKRLRRVAAVLGGCGAVAVLFLVQARLVDATFTSPLSGGDGRLPASLEELMSGPGPLAAADLPPAMPLTTPAESPAGALQTPVTSDSPAPPATGSASGLPLSLASWAAALAPQVGVPPVALAAYGAAQLAVAQAQPGCHLSWPTLAGIGSVESNHGRFAGAVLGADGRSSPPIIGVPLDGAPGVARIADTDGGQLDGDPTLDRAVGPMQFIPSTWASWGADGDADGRRDPFDIDDAALAAADYLCAAGGDLASGSGWTGAVYAYNASDNYVISVRETADYYANRSRLATG